MKSMTIGNIAKAVGLGVETIRFYEREGLIEQPIKPSSGYRQYTQYTLERLRFIKSSKDLGFSLKEVNELLTLKVLAGTQCQDIKKLIDLKLEDIDSKIGTLQKMKKNLKQLTGSCIGTGPIENCSIIDSLETKNDNC